MSNFVYLSKEKLKGIEDEVRELKTTGRKQMAERIAEAIAFGDLSENAEYDAAKEEPGLLELKINKYEDLLSRARIIDISLLPADQVHILSKVRVKNLNNSKEYEYTLVSQEEADLEQGKIAMTSSVGSSLLGKKLGEITQATVSTGLFNANL
ncbi:MAG: transcription elongation factor GreA [Bacteroidetes bacterium]|nr:transcription elongation factor GreA [Bacteroidota bacterium]